MSQLLVLIVAVLGTVVGITLIAVIIWICVLWNRKKRKRKWCWQLQPRQSHSRDAYSFPPHREMIELGCLHASNNFMGHQHQLTDYNNNNTGVSRGLGLGASYMMDQLPALPAPRSWTPSPPFDSQQINRSSTLPGVAERSHHSRSWRGDSYASGNLRSKFGIHPKLSTFKKSTSAQKIQFQDSKSCQQCHNSDFVDVNLGSETSDNEQSLAGIDLSQHTKSARFSKSAKITLHKTPEQHVLQSRPSAKPAKSLKEMQQYGAEFVTYDRSKNNYNEQFNDQPVACSSNCGSPGMLQPAPSPSYNSSHNSYYNSRYQDLPSYSHHSRPKNFTGEDLSCRKKYGNMELTRRTVCMLPQILETSPTPDSTIESFSKSPVKLADSHSTRSQTNTRRYPSSPSFVQRSSAFNPSTPRNDEVIASNFSEKYGFCQSCGKHPDVHKTIGGIKLITRSTQTHWTRCKLKRAASQKNRDVTVDPTPSLSWDNLTPAPSPILTLGDTVDEYGTNGNERRENCNSDGNGNENSNVLFGDEEGCEEGAVGGW